MPPPSAAADPIWSSTRSGSATAGDARQSAIYAEASLLDAGAVGLAVASAPLMVGATLLGRRINSRIGERGYTFLFWGVMGGYSARLLFA